MVMVASDPTSPRARPAPAPAPELPSMSRRPSRALSVVPLFCLVSIARADEPPKPTPTATESNPAIPAPGHSIHGEAFNEGPRQKAHLMPGMGKVSFPVSVTKAEAQQFI